MGAGAPTSAYMGAQAPTPPPGGASSWWGDVEVDLASRNFLQHNAGVGDLRKLPVISTRVKRIEHIRSMQDDGRWHGQRSVIELAALWNIKRDEVLGLVTAANQELEEAEGTPTAIRAAIIRRFTTILREGSGMEVIKAGEALAKLTGANAPSVDLVTYVRSMSLEDRRAFCQKIIKQATEILDSLPATDTSEPSTGT